MYRRYEGNSGRSRPVPESGRQQGNKSPQSRPPPPPLFHAPPKKGSGLGEELGKLLPKGLPELETEDLILLLVLYLLYRESGDSELLIMMGAMFLL